MKKPIYHISSFALLLLCSMLISTFSAAQQQITFPTDQTSKKIHLRRTNGEINLDGNLDEPEWQKGKQDYTFWQYFPTDTTVADGQTELYMLYDDENIYIALKCYSAGDQYVIQSLRRDYGFLGNDNVSVLFDTFNDKNNAFLFGMNASGARREALIANGGRNFNDFTPSWDNKWYGDAQMHGDFWIAEFAIPFKTLRFQKGSTQWRFNCYRNDTQHNEWSSFTPIPRNFLIMDVNFMSNIIWDEPLQKSGKNISVIPYLTGGFDRDYEDDQQNGVNWNGNIGGDAKVAITSGLNLDLTVNPDFSQVEVDQQVTNLNRFEIFFPERRQFFLENADLFGTFGLGRVNPFFSRRIGVAQDTATGVNIQNTIFYGARLNGKLNENLRVGLLNMQTAAEQENGLPSFNYSVFTMQHKMFSRSNLSGIFVNKQAINSKDFEGDFNEYNRVAGLEYRIASADNRWTGKVFYQHAFTPYDNPDPFSQGLQVEYLRRNYRFEWAHVFVGEGFDAEVGFVPRDDYMLLSPEAGLIFFPENSVFNRHSFNLDLRFFMAIGKDDNAFLPDWTMSEQQTELEWSFQLENNTRGSLTLTNNNLTLLNDFDPTRLQDDDIVLAEGSNYQFLEFEGEYTSDQRKIFSWSVNPSLGQFFNGYRLGFGGNFTYRIQPYGSIGIRYNYNYIELDKPFRPVNIWLVGPRFDLTFSKELFFSTAIQYNNQLDNLNINARFQWRFAPVSDFFLVYTDNYLVEEFSQFGQRNRALVAKITYWLNL